MILPVRCHFTAVVIATSLVLSVESPLRFGWFPNERGRVKMRGEISLGKVSTFDKILRVVGDFAKLK